MASRAAKNYLKSRDDRQLVIYNERFQSAQKFVLEEQATLVEPQRCQLSALLVGKLDRYHRANQEVFQLMRRRDTILRETLDPHGLRMRENLTRIMVSAYRDEDTEAAYLAGRALERVLLGRLYMFKFLENNREVDAERVRSELGSGFRQDFDQMVIAIDNAERKDLLQEFSTSRDIYLAAFEEMVLTIQKRNTLISQEVEPLDESVADVAEQIKLSLKADQDTLGPSIQASNAATIRTVLVGSTVAVLLSVCIAWIFVRTITRSIAALGKSEAETERLSREIAARKETERQLNDAKERLTHELAVARELADVADREHQVWLQGESIAVRALRESVEACAGSDDPVLLTGAAGAGQEAVARAIHRKSPRASRPFIYVACPHVEALDDTLFGLRPDDSERHGPQKMALADGGTLYLEGIEILNESAQQHLLQVLRDAASQRDAGQKPTPDVRVIACAFRDLGEGGPHGHFDDALTSLLGTRRLAVPSLAERRDDVIALANSIVTERARSQGKTLDGLSAESEEMLLRYSWPGNLDELRSVVERAVVLATGTNVDIPAELLREGRRVGGYTLERQLGSGAMGEVWLARHALLARPSAVKLIRQEALRGDAAARKTLEQRFQREAQTTSQLRSPHTVELYDFGVTAEGGFYYVMEYLNGVDLDSLVTKYGPVEPARAVFLLRQACMSLGEAHLAGLVHRDVKPANLFACQLGPHYDFLKLLDFGIVRMTTGPCQTVTTAGQLKGTPNSLAPEVVQGKQAGFTSDIYGLGCVAYWLLSGKHVFEAPDLMGLLMQHVSRAPKPLSEHRSDLAGELDELVMSCLAKDPADRPSSAFELAERLSSVSLDEMWDNCSAEAWWKTHMPESEGETLNATWTETMILNPDDTG